MAKQKKVTSVFAANLKKLISEKELSQRDVAKLAGVSVSSINDWLSGMKPSDSLAVLNLCKALNCDFQWLLTGTHSSPTRGATLSEFFDIESDPSFSGIFIIEAKRLKKKS